MRYICRKEEISPLDFEGYQLSDLKDFTEFKIKH